MDIEYDEDKRLEIYEKHGVDILVAALTFKNPVITTLDDCKDYGEELYISLGLIDDEAYVVVRTPRQDKLRIITAWKGGKRGKETYRNRFKDAFA